MKYYACVFEFSGDGDHKLIEQIDGKDFKSIYEKARKDCRTYCHSLKNCTFTLFYRGDSVLGQYLFMGVIPASDIIFKYAFAEMQCFKAWNGQRYAFRKI